MSAALYADVASGADVPVATVKKGDTVLEWCGGSAPEGGGEVEDPGFCEAHVGAEKGSAAEGEGSLRSQDANRSSTSDEARQNSPGEAID